MCDYDYIFQFLVMGDCKTSFIARNVDNIFIENKELKKTYIKSQENGIGNSFKSKLIVVDNIRTCFIKYMKYYKRNDNTPNYKLIKLSDCIFISFDVTNKDSFYNVERYYYEILKHKNENTQVMIIGCKIDDYRNRVIDKSTALQLSHKLSLPYFEINNKSPTLEEFETFQNISTTIIPQLIRIYEPTLGITIQQNNNNPTSPVHKHQQSIHHPPPTSSPSITSFIKFLIKNK